MTGVPDFKTLVVSAQEKCRSFG